MAYILFIILYVCLPKDIANYGGCDNEGQSVAAAVAAAATEAVAAASL